MLRDDIHSFSKFTILTGLKIEGAGVKGTLRKKISLKIKTVEDIEVKITQNDLESKRDGWGCVCTLV